MIELLIYAVALGVSASLLVPILYGFVSKFLPTSVTSGASVPTTYPTTTMGILWSVVIWGVFLGLALWVVSLIPFAGRAIRENA